MNDYITFTESKGIITFSVKKQFTEEVKDYLTQDIFDLLDRHKMGTFLHNPHGPAIIVKKDNKVINKQYWLDGKRLSDKDGIKMEFDAEFSGAMDKVLVSDDQ